MTIIDSTITNTNTFLKTAWTTSSSPTGAGNLIIENVALNNVPTAIQGPNGVYLAGGTTTISGFGQGHQYTPTGPSVLNGAFHALLGCWQVVHPNISPRASLNMSLTGPAAW